MSRLFYTCPIKAAYMSKEFGVKCYLDQKNVYSIVHEIEIPNKGVNGWKKQLRTDGTWDKDLVDNGKQQYLKQPDGGYKIYVALESEHIFEPKIDDVGINGNGDYCVFNGEQWLIDAGKRYIAAENADIIFRGKHFFMPEVENENL